MHIVSSAASRAGSGSGLPTGDAGSSDGESGISRQQALSGGVTALSALSTLAAGFARKRQLEEQALQEETAARQEAIRGLEEGNQLTDDYLDVIARSQVAFGAAGVSAFSGTARRITENSQQDGEANVATARRNSFIQSMTRRAMAQSYKKQARGAVGLAALQSVVTLAEGGARAATAGAA